MLDRLGFKIVHEQTFTNPETNVVQHTATHFNYKAGIAVEVMDTAGMAQLMVATAANTPTGLNRTPLTNPFRTFYTNPEILEALILEMKPAMARGTKAPEA